MTTQSAAWPLAALSLLAAALAAPAARAQVLEVQADGSVRTLGAPAPAAGRPAAGTSRRRLLAAAAARYDLAPELVDAVARTESRYDAGAVSPKGAVGMMQLLPATARALGVDPHDPVGNLMGGAAYLRQQLDRFGGRIDLALAAYNAGPGAVARYGGVPPYRETQGYVTANLSRLAEASLASTADPIRQGVKP